MNLNIEEIELLRWSLMVGGGLLSFAGLYAASRFFPGWLEKLDLSRFDLLSGVVAALAVGIIGTTLWHERDSVITAKFHQMYHDYWWESTVRDTRWRGQPLLKTPFDLWVFQEIIYERSPDVVIETGPGRAGRLTTSRPCLT